MPAPRPLREPAKELRFTRARQAIDFALLGVLFSSLAAGLAVMASPHFSIRGHGPLLASYWPALASLVPVGEVTPPATSEFGFGERNRAFLHDDTIYYVLDEDVWSAFWLSPTMLNGPF